MKQALSWSLFIAIVGCSHGFPPQQQQQQQWNPPKNDGTLPPQAPTSDGLTSQTQSQSQMNSSHPHPYLGQHQKEIQQIVNSLVGGKFRVHDMDSYNNTFAPPSHPQSKTKEILVDVGLKQIRVKHLDDTYVKLGQGEASIEAIVTMEWNDTRLTFEQPQGYKRNFIKVEADFVRTPVWRPKFQVNDEVYCRKKHKEGGDDIVILSKDGRVYMEKKVVARLELTGLTKLNGFESSLQIKERLSYAEQVTFRPAPNTTNSTLQAQAPSKRVISQAGILYSVAVVNGGKCTNVAQLGSIASLELSCMEIKFTLTQEKK